MLSLILIAFELMSIGQSFTGIELFAFPCASTSDRGVLGYHRCISGRFASAGILNTEQSSVAHYLLIHTQRDDTVYNYSTITNSGATRSFVAEGDLNLDDVVSFQTNFTLSGIDTFNRPNLALGYESTIARDSEFFILTPSSIVLAPTAEWENRNCVGNFFLRTPIAEGFNNWSIYATLRIGSEWISGIPHVYSLDTSSLISVFPDSDYLVFLGMLRSVLSSDLVLSDFGLLRIQDCHEIATDYLPIIQLTVRDNSDVGIAEILLTPDDYIADDGSCQILVRGQTMPDDIPDSVLTIGENILRNINLSFSARDRLVGFCDPVA